MLDLNDLRLFVHIVEHQGTLKARLIIRSSEEFSLSPAGEEVYRLARAVVDVAP